MLKQNGAAKVVIAANKGMKMDIARQLDAADEYIDLDRANPEAQWAKIKEDYKYGFDIVVRLPASFRLFTESDVRIAHV